MSPALPTAPAEPPNAPAEKPAIKPWRRLLSRALVLGALGLALVELAPAFPEEHQLQIRARHEVTSAQVAYYDEAGELLLQTEQNLASPAKQVTFLAKLPRGLYTVSLVCHHAEGPPAGDSGKSAPRPRVERKTQKIELSGGTVVLRIP